MKKNLRTAQKRTMRPVSIIAAAICSLLSVNAIAQAPPPTNPLVVNVLSTGATPNDGTNDTAAIQLAVSQVAGTGGTVLVPAGTYMVDALVSVNLGSNMTFKMESGAVLKAIPNDTGTYNMVTISGKTNINIVGGKLQGERHQHLTPGDFINHSPYGEWGMGIRIGSASSHIYMEGVTVTECWGDGIYIGGSAVSTDITILGVVCDDNRRQGCSITWADGVLVKNSGFNNTVGTAPQYGIDIEPNAGNYVKNVQILNSQFINNKSTGVGLHSAGNPEISNITITGNTISGSWRGISVYKSRSGITVSNNTLTNNSALDGIIIEGSTSVNNTYSNNTISVSPAITGDHAGIRIKDGATGNTGTGNCISGYPYTVKDEAGGNNIIGGACNGATISVAPTSLATFGEVPTGTTSDEQSYTLTGINLTDNVTVTAPAGYEISTTSGSGFGSSKTVTQTGGTVSQTIYVRFTPTAVQVYNGNVTNASPGVATMNVALTGSGTGKATGASDVKKSSSTITIDGSLSECDWANANSSTFINAVQSNNTVKISTLWDSANLYMAYEVTDSQIETPAVSIWSQDAIELYLDAGHEKSTAIDANDYQFIISAANEIGYFQAAVGKTIQKAVTISGPGYIVEMAVPWAQIGIIPAEGTALGALFANDDRDAGVSKSFDWKDLRSTGGFARPNLWGDILLSGTKACVVTSLGTDLHQANGMSIFPSPASEFLTVVLAGISGKQQIHIFNSIGSLVKVVELTGSSQIDISGLPNGLYFIYLKNNSLKAQKFIKQRIC
ncbi:MAG: right-handed parallel beta-helix repeat-containing protein [Prolixibacteraceae bacterium]|nr:right-handed parallel beta-helix repeat-containing protein [Prolixibacteraceae bacterium]